MKLTRQDIDDILVEFDTMDYMPTNLCADAEFERNQYKGKLVKMAKEILDYKNLENQIGCSLDIAHSVQPGKVVRVLFPDNHIYRCIVDKVSYFGFTLSGEPDSPDFIYFKQYKQIWWLKDDRGE